MPHNIIVLNHEYAIAAQGSQTWYAVTNKENFSFLKIYRVSGLLILENPETDSPMCITILQTIAKNCSCITWAIHQVNELGVNYSVEGYGIEVSNFQKMLSNLFPIQTIKETIKTKNLMYVGDK